MRTIFKYILETKDEQTIRVPGLFISADLLYPFEKQVLNVGVQNNKPCIWCLVDTEAPVRDTRVLIRGTGHDCKGAQFGSYLGSYMLINGGFVGHVFQG